MTPLTRRAALAALLMGGAAAAGHALQPTRRLAATRGGVKLADLVPQTFGAWQLDPHARGSVVNPQTQALLDKLYSEVLERSYLRSDDGGRIMLSVAYGEDQTDPSVQLHYPEVCYPAQGFRVTSNRADTLSTPVGRLPVRRLETHYAEQRYEPVTYWTVVGDDISLGGWQRKVAELRHGFRGEIVDGMLVRVSSISRNTPQAFALQDTFIKDLLQALNGPACQRLAGRCQRAA